MKLRSSIAIASLTLVLWYAAPALAISATPAGAKAETIRTANETYKEERQQAAADLRMKKASGAADFKDAINDARTDRRATISAARQLYRSERAQVHGERLERRFAWYAERLSNIAKRIQSRIDTQKTAGKDTAAAQAALDKANTLLTQAVTDGKMAVSLFQNIAVSTWSTQEPQIKAAIDQAMKARMGFVNTRLALIDAAAAL